MEKRDGKNDKKRGAKEDYLRVIFELDDNGVKSIDIAKKLKITKASVSEMLRKLSSSGYIKLKPYSKIFLTKKGKIHAEKHYDKHDILQRFLAKLLNYEDEQAYDEAHKIEHAMSDNSVNIIREMLEGKKYTEIKFIPSYIG